jgi:flavin-dependent dehydrogenase
MTVPARADVVVIGGGPAGSAAAARLRRLGYDTVLLEAHRHPRYTVGESIVPHFWNYCDLIGVSDRIAAEGFLEKAGGTVIWDGTIRQMRFRDFGYSRPALHVERDRFDHILLSHARECGVQVFEEVAAVDADVGRECPSVRYRAAAGGGGAIACHAVVDASGQSAVLAKRAGTRRLDQDFRFMSLWGYFVDARYVGADGRAHPHAEVRTVPPTTFIRSIGRWGWAWHIPLREKTSVGFVLPHAELKAALSADDDLTAVFLRRCRTTPHLDRLLEGACLCEGSVRAIRDYSYRTAQPAGPGFFLTGDAAGFVDPIFSVGVAFAMYSGVLAAWAIDRSRRAPHRGAAYRATFTQQILGRLDLARALALPGDGPAAGGAAAQFVRFESRLEQALIDTATRLATRNGNYRHLGASGAVGGVDGEGIRVLEEIAF